MAAGTADAETLKTRVASQRVDTEGCVPLPGGDYVCELSVAGVKIRSNVRFDAWGTSLESWFNARGIRFFPEEGQLRTADGAVVSAMDSADVRRFVFQNGQPPSFLVQTDARTDRFCFGSQVRVKVSRDFDELMVSFLDDAVQIPHQWGSGKAQQMLVSDSDVTATGWPAPEVEAAEKRQAIAGDTGPVLLRLEREGFWAAAELLRFEGDKAHVRFLQGSEGMMAEAMVSGGSVWVPGPRAHFVSGEDAPDSRACREKISKTLPELNSGNSTVLMRSSSQWNCLAEALGKRTTWMNGFNWESLDLLMAQHAFVPLSEVGELDDIQPRDGMELVVAFGRKPGEGGVDLWGDAFVYEDYRVEHFVVTRNGAWESKEGHGPLIRTSLLEPFSKWYGSALRVYARPVVEWPK